MQICPGSAKMKANGQTVETISIVLQYFVPESGDYNEETGEWSGSYIDCVVTFE